MGGELKSTTSKNTKMLKGLIRHGKHTYDNHSCGFLEQQLPLSRVISYQLQIVYHIQF